MSTLFRDSVYALRKFRAARVFTATAVLTLALGIGGTTAIFTLIHAVMLKSLPVGDPSLLYRIGDGDNCCVQGGPQDRWGMFSFPLFERLKAEVPEFEELTAFQAGRNRMSVRRQGVDDAPRPLRTIYVTGNYFKTLGVSAFAGRVFSADDDRPAASPVVVMAYHAWQGVYGGDASIVGATLVVEGTAFTVAGVTPPGFFGETLKADPPDLWVPLQQEPLIAGGETSLLRQPISSWLRVIGRLRPGATIAGMDARLTGLLRQWMRHEAGYPSNWMPEIERTLPQQVIAVVPAGAGVGVMKEQYGRSLRILLAVCVLVLLIACANVANLLLARAVARRGQTAVRLAMGASRRQIVTEALVESVLLAIGGAIAGLIVAMGAARLLLSLAFAGATTLPIDTMPSPAGARLRDRPGARDRPALRRRAGVVRDADRIPSRRCAARAAPPATARRSRARRCSSCRPRSPWCWWRARRCSAAAWAISRDRTSASTATAACWCRWAVRRRRSPANGSRRSTATWKRGSRASRACRARGSRSTTRSPTTGARACSWPASRCRRRASRPARRGTA